MSSYQMRRPHTRTASVEGPGKAKSPLAPPTLSRSFAVDDSPHKRPHLVAGDKY